MPTHGTAGGRGDGASPGRPGEPEEILEALADLVGAGRTPLEGLVAMQTIGGATGRWAARLAAATRRPSGFAAALVQAEGLSARESAFLGRADGMGHLPAALRVLAAHRRASRVLRQDLLRSAIGPLTVLGLTLLALPLPNLFLGGSYVRPLLGHVAILAVGALAVLVGLPRLLRHPSLGPRLVDAGNRVPPLADLMRLHSEATLAGALAALVADHGITPEAVRTAGLLLSRGPLAEVLAAPPARGGADPAPGSPLDGVVSESLALVLLTDRDSARLAERLARFGDRARGAFSARARLAVRLLAWGLVIVVSVESVGTLLSSPLPGLGAPGKVDRAGLEELERLLDSAR